MNIKFCFIVIYFLYIAVKGIMFELMFKKYKVYVKKIKSLELKYKINSNTS